MVKQVNELKEERLMVIRMKILNLFEVYWKIINPQEITGRTRRVLAPERLIMKLRYLATGQGVTCLHTHHFITKIVLFLHNLIKAVYKLRRSLAMTFQC